MTLISAINSVVDDVLQASSVPIYKLVVDGVDISSKVNNRLGKCVLKTNVVLRLIRLI